MNKYCVCLGVAAAALTSSVWAQAAAGQNPSTATAKQPAQEVTIVGCVQREADYRRLRDQGRGGVAGTGVGAGDEFVLINASSANSKGTVGTAGAGASAATDAAAGTMSYELSGSSEKDAAQFVGRRVEITGRLKAEEIGPSGPTGGPTAGAPPAGIDAASTDLKLRELEVSSVRAASGPCPAQ